mgnify:CR=1 FL=1
MTTVEPAPGATCDGDVPLRRGSAYSYRCRACNKCCRDKIIPVSPYEIFLLARHLDLDTTAVIARHTEAGGTVLQVEADNVCVFLGERGCAVHPARPLACRIYPLGAHIDADGDETFSRLEPHPATAGVYGRDGTVADYLAAQGVAPFMDAHARYAELHARMMEILLAADDAEAQAYDEARAALPVSESGRAASDWLDIDKMLGAAARNVVPETVVTRHIAAIEADLTP